MGTNLSGSNSKGSDSGKGSSGGSAWWPRQQCVGAVLFAALLATAVLTVALRTWQASFGRYQRPAS